MSELINNVGRLKELIKDLPDDTTLFTLYHSNYLSTPYFHSGFYDEREKNDLNSPYELLDNSKDYEKIPEEHRKMAIILWQD